MGSFLEPRETWMLKEWVMAPKSRWSPEPCHRLSGRERRLWASLCLICWRWATLGVHSKGRVHVFKLSPFQSEEVVSWASKMSAAWDSWCPDLCGPRTGIAPREHCSLCLGLALLPTPRQLILAPWCSWELFTGRCTGPQRCSTLSSRDLGDLAQRLPAW